ncbi:hypothetical protein [Streptomyces anulatus]|uniref:hypothetical protein n=1 Tax=Streptomyces anulatus TaxID=1892 RepID=UPI003862F003|nr:hypothetical protein OHB50_21285 [Streptomyces anulatus]
MTYTRGTGHTGRGRQMARGAAAGTLTGALVVAAGWLCPEASAAPATPAPEVPPAVTATTLADGDRLEVLPGEGATQPGFRIVSQDGGPAGRYAYALSGDELTVLPTGRTGRTTPTRTDLEPRPEQTGGRSGPSAGESGRLAGLSSAPRGGTAGSAATATYPVTFSVANSLQDTSSIMRVWDSTTWQPYDVETDQFALRGTASLPPGNYFALTVYGSYNQPDYLLAKSFKVTSAAVKVVFDQAGAKETGIRTDDASVTRTTAAVSASLPNGQSIGYAGGGRSKVFVTPFIASGSALHIHEVQGRKGATPQRPSPVRYDLSHTFERTVPADPVAQVRQADLAETELTVRGGGQYRSGFLQTVPNTPYGGGVYLSAPVPVAGFLTEYVTPGRTFSRIAGYGTHTFELPDRTLQKGVNRGETVGRAPYAPTGGKKYVASRLRDDLTLYGPFSVSDSDGAYGRDAGATQSYRLSANGETVTEVAGKPAQSPVALKLPPGQGTYELVRTVTRDGETPFSRLSDKLISEWSFTSGTTTTRTDLGLPDIGFRVSGLGLRNETGPTPSRVVATVNAPDGTPRLRGLEFSVDGGTTWTPIPVAGSSATAEGEVPVTQNTRYVSLRATGSDERTGTTVRQTVSRAFAGPAGVALPPRTAGATAVSGVTVNENKPLVLDGHAHGSSAMFPVQFTATDPSGIAGGSFLLYQGAYNKPDAVLADGMAHCRPVDATTSTCSGQVSLAPHTELGDNALAGVWKVAVAAHANDGQGVADQQEAGAFRMMRKAVLAAADATPEPVTAGGDLTVTSRLTASDWTDEGYAAFAGQPVTLQFRQTGTTAWSDVRTVTSGADGSVTTTLRAWKNGDWRWTFAATPAATAASSAADYVEVK